MIRLTTGNCLDVVYEYEDHIPVIRGLKPWGDGELIPLPDPEGLYLSLRTVLREHEQGKMKRGTTKEL